MKLYNLICDSEKVERFAEFYQRIFFDMVFPVLLWALMICVIVMYAWNKTIKKGSTNNHYYRRIIHIAFLVDPSSKVMIYFRH